MKGNSVEEDRQDMVFIDVARRIRRSGAEGSRALDRRKRLFQAQAVGKSSDKTRTVGGPPVEIDAACANASFPPADSAQTCSTASDGNVDCA